MSNSGRQGKVNLDEAEFEDLEHIAGKDLEYLKKVQYTIAYIIWVLAPVASLDWIRLAKTGGWKNPFYYPTLFANLWVRIGDILYNVGDRIPVLGYFLKGGLASPFYLLAPVTLVSGFTWEEFTESKIKEPVREEVKEKGKELGKKAGKRAVKRASRATARTAEREGGEEGSKFIAKRIPAVISRLGVTFWDDAISLPAAATVVGGIALTFIDTPFSTGTYKAMELWGIDRKWVKKGGIRRWLVTAFLPKQYDEDGNVIQDFTKSSSDPAKYNEAGGNTVMADGGERGVTESRPLEADGGGSRDWSIPGAGGGRTAGKWLRRILIGSLALGVLLVGFVGISQATGAGSGWGFVLSDTFGGYTSGLGNIGEELGYTVNSVVTTAACLGDAGCFNEWRLNQTTEPGSEDVGETYELQVQGPRVFGTSSGGIDVSNIPPDYPIPMDFSIHNTRHGLDGIPAENVDYRFLIRDPQVVGSGSVLCSTADLKGSGDNGWISLDKYHGSEGLSPQLQETSDTILPGGTMSPLKYSAENRLTLKECGLLQPGPTNSYEVVLQIRYDYSAFSILQMQVMSEQHRRDKGIEVRSKRSETPNTPVETFVRASSPATYRTVRNGEGEVVDRVATPIRTEIGFSADEDNIRYKIDSSSFVFEDSDLTEAISSTCGGLENSAKSGEDTFGLSQSIRNQIETTQKGKTSEWFSSRSKPSSAYCAFTYDPSEISPTGETITFTAQADYTVLQAEPKEQAFTLRNTLCRNQNCPQVVPLNPTEETATTLLSQMETGSEAYRTKKYSMCGQPQDAESGCSVIQSFSLQDRVKGSITDTVIEQGDIALKLRESMGGQNFYTCYARDNAPKNTIVGISERDLKALWQGQQKALNYSNGNWNKVTLYRSDPNPSEGCKKPSKKGSGSDGSSGEGDGSGDSGSVNLPGGPGKGQTY